MFEQLEHKRTPAETKTLFLESLAAVAACILIGGAAIWFFTPVW